MKKSARRQCSFLYRKVQEVSKLVAASERSSGNQKFKESRCSAHRLSSCPTSLSAVIYNASYRQLQATQVLQLLSSYHNIHGTRYVSRVLLKYHDLKFITSPASFVLSLVTGLPCLMNVILHASGVYPPFNASFNKPRTFVVDSFLGSAYDPVFLMLFTAPVALQKNKIFRLDSYR